VLLALAVGGPAVEAQSADTPTKSAWTAGILEYVVPTAGYAYADAWKEGLLPGAVRVSGTVALLWVMTDALTGEPGDGEPPDECRTMCVYGIVATTVGYVWGVTGAVRAAKRWTPERAGLTLGWSPETSSLRVGVRVGF
jgi:predicted acyltransferase